MVISGSPAWHCRGFFVCLIRFNRVYIFSCRFSPVACESRRVFNMYLEINNIYITLAQKLNSMRKIISVNMDADIADELTKVAYKERRSRSNMLEYLADEFLKKKQNGNTAD